MRPKFKRKKKRDFNGYPYTNDNLNANIACCLSQFVVKKKELFIEEWKNRD